MSETLLKVENLAVSFRQGGQETEAVRGVSFALKKGETLGIVGESGSGKSVSALSVLRLLSPNAHHPTGKILFKEQDLLAASDKEIRAIRGDKIAMIFQEPMTSLNPLHSIKKQITETLSLHKGLSGKAAEDRCLELLRLVEIRDPERRLNALPHELSGGQRQRVMIAMALANEPDLLIADEPTTALDVTVQAQILTLLKKLQKELGMACLMISHDLDVIRAVATDVCVMKNGKIVEAGPVAQVMEKPAHPYTQMLLASDPAPKSIADGPDDSSIAYAADKIAVSFPLAKNLFGKVTQELRAVDNVSVTVPKGKTLGIVGESGSGKTTLAMSLLRLQSSTGAIRFNDKRIDTLTAKEMRDLRPNIQIVFQDPFGSLSPRMTVGDIVGEGLAIHQIGTKDERDGRICTALEEVGLDPDARHRYPHEFSGGQRQRIAVARALILKPEVLFLDEPTSALDVSVQAQLIDLLQKLQKERGLTYLFISHDLKVVRALSDEIIVMKDGKIVEKERADTLFNAPQHPYTQKLLEAAFALKD